MRHSAQVDLIHRFLKLRADRTTDMAPDTRHHDVGVYVDEGRATAEQALLFRGRPLVAALSGDLPDTGDCVAVDVGDVPTLLVRGEDGQVRAFLNACRHRGSRVAEGHGHAGRVFTCPYHAWTYDLHGDLLGQPLAREGFAGEDREALGLHPIPVAEVAGLLVVAPGATGPLDVEDWLGGVHDELASWDFDRYRFFDERVVEVDCNWKLAYDTFLEAYHIFSLHSRTVGKGLLSTPAVGDTFGPHGRGVVFGKQLARTVAELPEDEWDLLDHSSVVYQLFPNAVINLPSSGHAEVWQAYPHPSDPSRCRVHLRFYTPEGIPEGPEGDRSRAFFQRNLDFTAEVVLTEDFQQQEAIQRNIASGLMHEMVFGRNEPALQNFHASIDAVLARGAAE